MEGIKSVLVTGGTGSFGKKFIEILLKEYPHIQRIVVYSRDELKQFEMRHEPRFIEHDLKLRYFIGDVRDRDRLVTACEGIDAVVHAAALKQVPASEYNPMECIKTNILGAENVINAAIKNNVKKVVALSTDKAAAPINLYGATKLCSDKLFVAANNLIGHRDLKFMVVRYGNVMGSRGSVIPFFMRMRETGEIPITHEEMTRFNITLDHGVRIVIRTFNDSLGGELVVPKIPSYKIMTLAEAIAPGCKHKMVGIRPGEKLHEEMITDMDSMSTLEFDDHYIIFPTTTNLDMNEYIAAKGGKKVEYGFKYHSGINHDWLSVEDIRSLIKEHVDPNFSVQ